MTKNLLVSKQVAEQSYSEFKTSFDGKYAKLIQQKKMPKKYTLVKYRVLKHT